MSDSSFGEDIKTIEAKLARLTGQAPTYSPTELAKIDRFIKAVENLGSRALARARVRVTEETERKWMQDIFISQQVENAEEAALAKEDWMQILFEAKVLPKLDIDLHEMTGPDGLRPGEGNTIAAWVALHGLHSERAAILAAANANDARFFIALGKYLSGELKPELWDALDETIAKNWKNLRTKSRGDATAWLARHGFPELDVQAFRQRLVSLGLTSKKSEKSE